MGMTLLWCDLPHGTFGPNGSCLALRKSNQKVPKNVWFSGLEKMFTFEIGNTSGCGRLMANRDYWGLMGIYFHAISLSWGLMEIIGDYWG